MDGVILAAGPGMRLRPLTNAVPKALVSVGSYPLAEHVVRGFSSAGVDRIVMVTGYMARKVESYFGDGTKWDVSIVYVRQEVARGTADAVAIAATEVETRPFFVGYGDIFIADPRNYTDFLAFHLNGGFDFSIMCNREEDPYEGAAVYLEGDRVTRLVEKPPKGESTTKLNKRGVLLLDHRIFDLIDEVKPRAGDELYLTDAISLAIERGMSVGGYICQGYTSDVGTHERLAEARRIGAEM